MKRRVRLQPDPDRLVVLPDAGEPLLFARTASGVALQGDWSPTPEGTRPPAASLQVLPQGRLICRSFDLPEADASQLETALRLQVEAQQLGAVPAWRTACMVLPPTGASGRVGVSVEWPANDVPPAVRRDLPPDGDPMHAGDVACLLALIARGVNGPLVCVAPDRDAFSFAFRFGTAVVVRSARLDATQWPTGAETAVLESALRAGLDEPALRRLLQALRDSLQMAETGGFGCTRDDLSRLVDLCEGTPAEDAAWWRANGLAVAAALGWFGSTRALVALRHQPPGERPSRLGDFLNHIAEPALASRLLVAALLALALAPPLVTGARLLLLQWKVGDLAAREQAIQAHRQRVAMYSELQRRAWPMGKLLGDLACVTPEGIDWQDITLSQDRNVSVRGVARPQDGQSGSEVLLKMERQMRDSRIFDKVQKKWDASDGKGSVDFTLSAQVARPTLRPNYSVEQDFGRKTLSERRYGPEKPEEPEAPQPVASAEPGTLPHEPSLADDTSHAENEPHAAPAGDAASHATDTAGEGAKHSTGGGKKKGKGDGVSAKPSGKVDTKPASKPAAATPKDAGGEAAASQDKPGETPATGAGEEGDGAGKQGRAGRRAGAGSGSGGLARRTERTPGSSDGEFKPPPPLSDADIQAMTLPEVSEALRRVAEARRRDPRQDEAVTARLKEEFTKLLARQAALKNAGGGS